MWRAVLIGVGTWGAWKAGKAAAGKIREHATSKSAEGNPMMILAKGATCIQTHIGPWRADDLTLGLAAMAKVARSSSFAIMKLSTPGSCLARLMGFDVTMELLGSYR